MPDTVVNAAATPENLSFVVRCHVGGGYDFWSGVPTGASYLEEVAIGSRLAEEFLDFIAAHPTDDNASLLGAIMLGMEEGGATRGHKIGFMNKVNRHAMIGAVALRKAPSDNAFDNIAEAIDFTRLVFNSVQGLGLDNDIKAISAGVYAVEKLLLSAQANLMEKDAVQL